MSRPSKKMLEWGEIHGLAVLLRSRLDAFIATYVTTEKELPAGRLSSLPKRHSKRETQELIDRAIEERMKRAFNKKRI